ncbi:hypothetical protein FA15DRAFT_671910 [Coprinopsis marcescibilis]|uniref:Rhodopsin domain-containing protein n=1 Tax=Coprinopsis marcescibilis TaxID=230819 RepID=A0A5C3KP98_COPMA|nr:hypothetical protein FA15DRAFT_671910 [Coprinopsis marcescibilis]
MLSPIQVAFVVVVALYLLCAVLTCIRLAHRFQRSQLWWDDFWAGLAALSGTFIAGLYIAIVLIKDRRELPQITQSFLNWAGFFGNTVSTWAARYSILTTIIRILPTGANRAITKVSFCIMGPMSLAIILAHIFMCGLPVPSSTTACGLPIRSIILQLTCGLTAIAWLVVWPIYILWRMKLPRTHRNLIVACFASAVSLAVIEILHANFLVKFSNTPTEVLRSPAFNPVPLTFTGNFQSIFAMFCCNNLVLVTFMYRIWRNKRDGSEGESETETSSDKSSSVISGGANTSDKTGDSNPSRSTTMGIFSSELSHFTTVLTNSQDDQSASVPSDLSAVSASVHKVRIHDSGDGSRK